MLEDARDRGHVFQASNFGAYILPHILTWDGKANEALEMRASIIAAFSQSDLHAQQMFAMISYAEAELYLEQPEEALRNVDRLWSHFRRSFLDLTES